MLVTPVVGDEHASVLGDGGAYEAAPDVAIFGDEAARKPS
jgi:hypothetical protein